MHRSISALVVLTCICFFLNADFAIAQLDLDDDDGSRVGLGLMIGEPTGISFKYWDSERNAFDAGLAWSLGQYDAIHLHGDYLWHNYTVFDDVEEGAFPVYYGIGIRTVFAEDDVVVGARIPVGINYIFERAPLDLFLEVVPTVNLAPATDFDINGALGIRIYL